MDIKAKVEEIVAKIKNDDAIADKFQKDPVSTVEGLIGVDLPNDQLQSIVDMVKSKVSLDKLGSKLGGLFGKK